MRVAMLTWVCYAAAMEQNANPVGYIVVNKPVDFTSHDVVNVVRKKIGVRKVGHSGTLDPLATGVLVILVGRAATKLQDQFMAQQKEYEAELTFGFVSETYDAEGPIAESGDASELTREAVEAVLPQFTGTIEQRPPAHSAIKVNGQRLYKKARKGTLDEADIPMRTVTIDAIELLDFSSDASGVRGNIRVTCQKGVYIRSLAHDIGQALGTGAYMSGLIRTKSGPYTVEEAIALEDVTVNSIQPLPTD